MIILLRLFPSLFSHISSFASALDVFSDRSGPVFRDDVSTVPDATDAAPTRGFAPAVGSRDSHTVAVCFVPDPSVGVLSRGRRECLFAAIECPEGSVVLCVDGVLASVGAAQTCEEACDRDCCIGPGVCDGLLIRVCRDSESCSGEGTCRDVSIDDVFLGCEGTEPWNRPETTRRWYGVLPESCVSPGGRVRRRDTGGIGDKPDKGSAACAGLDEGLVVGTDDGAGHA